MKKTIAHQTEKANTMPVKQYVFEVDDNKNKTEIKREIEKEYKVKVESVNIINIPRRPRRSGFRPGLKKAVVKTKQELTIK